jgi:hypothetical protein
MPLVRHHGFSPRIVQAPALLEAAAVYAIWDGTAVKVGTCKGHPRQRMAELQVGNPRRLELVAYTVSLTEAEAHKKLRKHRVRGEWHRLGRELLQEVSQWDWLDEDLYRQLLRSVTG